MSADQTFISHHSNHKPKDPNTSINCSTTLCTFDPIHSASDISFISLKQKTSTPKPAFGTSSTRVTSQLLGHKQSDIVAYSRIKYEKDQKYQDRYQQVKTKPTPFLSTCGRFNLNCVRNPGPGQYSIPQVFKVKQQKNPKQGPMFCPFKRWEVQQNRFTPFGSRWEQRAYLASLNHKENQSPLSPLDVQRRIQEKRSEIKEKMSILKQKMIKPKKVQINQMKSMGFSQKEQATPRIAQTPRQKSPQVTKSQVKMPNLRQMTTKYLPKLNYEFEREEYRTVVQVKNFKQTFNHQAVFLSKNDSVYRSYIPKNENPGPGHYQKRTKKIITRKLSSKMSQFFDLE